MDNGPGVSERKKSPEVSVVIPCFNEEGSIAETIADLHRHLGGGAEYEVIVVDDGSTDRSGDILASLVRDSNHLRVFGHDVNRGYGAALKTGIRRARSQLVAIMDADGTYPGRQIPELIQVAREADMVVGSRAGSRPAGSRIRYLPKLFLGWYASWIAEQSIPDFNSGMRVFRKPVVEKLMGVLPDSFSFTLTITLAMLTNHYDVRFVPIEYFDRVGKSKIRPIRDTLKFIQLIVRTGTYFAPLRVFSPVILILLLAFLASLVYDVYVLSNLTDKTVLLLLFSMNTTMFALLADMIDKRTGK